MTLKWAILAWVQYETIVITSPSIAGVTYMDHFDFEERYRDANECNPFYWHPLHLPAYCTEVFEKLIRSKLASNTPIRITRKKEKRKKQKNTDYSQEAGSKEYQSDYGPNYQHNNYEIPLPVYEVNSQEYETYNEPYIKTVRYMTPYEEMIEQLKEDIKKGPSSPTVTVMPNLGPVAVYNQAISKKSENMIRALSEMYVKATKKKYDEYYKAYGSYPSEPNLFVYDSAKNNTQAEIKKKDKSKKKDKKNKVYRMKTKHGNVVTIIEAKNLEMMKNDGFLL